MKTEFKAQPIDLDIIEYWHFVEWDCYPYSKRRRTRRENRLY